VSSLRKIWKSHDITMDTKVQLLRTLVWPVANYGCESWTLKRSHEDRLEVFEMRAPRQILQVSWMAKRTNFVDLGAGRCHQKFTAIANVKSRKLGYFGHVMRGEDKSFKKSIARPCPAVGREEDSRTAWIDNVTLWTGLKLEEAI